MFNNLGNSIRWERKRANFKDEIEWACRYLGKEDRVVWYLGIIQRAALMKKKMDGKILERPLRSKIQRMIKGFSLHRVRTEYLYNFKDAWEHCRNMQDMYGHSDMLGYPFFSESEKGRVPKSPDQVLGDFGKMEEKIQDAYKNERYCNDGSPFIEFDDRWKWVCIPEGKSKQEAHAMRHCGNGFGKPNDMLLSLRESIRKGNINLWKPHLTFILNDGYLGEMKGYANSKPKQKFHPYIARLLEDRRVDGLRGGGFMPTSNFSFSNLSVPLRTQVLAKNKNLDFDPIGSFGSKIVELDGEESWYHTDYVKNKQLVTSNSPSLSSKRGNWVSLQSMVQGDNRAYLVSEAWCSENRGVLGKLHFERETSIEDSEKVEMLLNHPFCKEVSEDLLETDSSWAQVLTRGSVRRLIENKPSLFKNTSIEKVFEHTGCSTSFASVFNDRYGLDSRAFKDEGLELESYDSFEELGQASGVGWLSRLLNNCQSKLRADQNIDFLQLGWLMLRKGVTGPCLFLLGDKILHFLKTMELEKNCSRTSLINEIILRFGPPDKKDFIRVLGMS